LELSTNIVFVNPTITITVDSITGRIIFGYGNNAGINKHPIFTAKLTRSAAEPVGVSLSAIDRDEIDFFINLVILIIVFTVTDLF
jgi:hypothetical protein